LNSPYSALNSLFVWLAIQWILPAAAQVFNEVFARISWVQVDFNFSQFSFSLIMNTI
jgi:hypothetical protein